MKPWLPSNADTEVGNSRIATVYHTRPSGYRQVKGTPFEFDEFDDLTSRNVDCRIPRRRNIAHCSHLGKHCLGVKWCPTIISQFISLITEPGSPREKVDGTLVTVAILT